MKKIVLTVALMLGVVSFSQENTENKTKLEAEKAKITSEIAKLKGEVSAIDGQLKKFNKGWKFGAMGTIGGTFSGSNNWFSNKLSTSETGNIGFVVNGFANLEEDDYFWKNAGTINLAWTKIVDLTKANISKEEKEFKQTSDAVNVSSLFGYKLTKSFAISALGEYRTTLFENFNNPGYLDIGLGATWTPLPELLVVVHPLNYNHVFSDAGSAMSNDFKSSLGCKIMADYNKDLGFLKFRSNMSAFASYTSADLSNYTWVNSVKFNVFKGIGVGLEGGVRQNKQEAYNALGGKKVYAKLADAHNKIQSYWLVGLNYGF